MEQFKRESDDILKLLETKVIEKALSETDQKEKYAIFNDENVFMTKWNQIRNKSREIIVKVLTTKPTLARIIGKSTHDMSSSELLEEIDAHLRYTDNVYNRIIMNMIPLQNLQMIKENEEKVLQIVYYVQQLERHAQKINQLSEEIRQLKESFENVEEFIINNIQKYNPMALIDIDIDDTREVVQLLPMVQNIIKELEKRPTHQQQEDIQQLRIGNILWRQTALYLSILKVNCNQHIEIPQ